MSSKSTACIFRFVAGAVASVMLAITNGVHADTLALTPNTTQTSSPTPAAPALRLPAFALYAQPTDMALKGDAVANKIEKPGRRAVNKWNSLVTEVQASVEAGAMDKTETAVELLDKVNRHWNRSVFFSTDARHYNLSDVWTTPFETLAEEAGDCEDFAIAKYFTLLRAGMAEQQLALSMDFYTPTGEAHITLTVTLANGERYTLDNINRSVVRTEQRSDLVPVLSMNRQVLSVFKMEYTQAAQDLAGRFSSMNKRYEQQLRDWEGVTGVAAGKSAGDAAS